MPGADTFQTKREAAQRRMQSRRDAAFLFSVDYICGIEVNPLSLRLWLVLNQMRSVFITGEFPAIGDNIGAEIRRFLWAVSTEFSPCEKSRAAFIKRVDKIDAAEALVGIREYVDIAFADSPYGSDGGTTTPHASIAAEVIDHMATQYGWTPDIVINIPLAQLWQIRNCIAARTQKQPVFSNREVDAAARDYLRSVKASKN